MQTNFQTNYTKTSPTFWKEKSSIYNLPFSMESNESLNHLPEKDNTYSFSQDKWIRKITQNKIKLGQILKHKNRNY